MMTDHDFKRGVVAAYVDGFGRGDAEALADLYAEHATVEDPVGTAPIKGRTAIQAFYRAAVARGIRLELSGEPRTAGDSVAFPFHVHRRHGGQDEIIEVIDIFRFDPEGHIIEMRAYWGPQNIKPKP
ncbi:nuclear transport factor 2 family protein [Brevundimonas sp. NPDC090276]|uniref:nuclear transport factor 2 family protein n=1 Tax=Brevundimonas sp. NPDC090276 TaxID=3363956 RepID=UPI00383B4819